MIGLHLILFTFVVFFILLNYYVVCNKESTKNLLENQKLVKIVGKASFRQNMYAPLNWASNSRVLLDYGKYIGFIKEDGNFIIEGVPPGSYIFEITNTDYIFETIRIDVSSTGKIRARLLNLLQPNAVTTLIYPLQIIARQPAKYFRLREEWRITDVLMNPMVIMLIAAFFLLIVTPKIASQDPQIKQEMQNVQLPKVPDVADLLASFFGGNSNTTNKKSSNKKINNAGGLSASGVGNSVSRRTRQ